MSTLTLGIIVIIYMFVIAWLGYLGYRQTKNASDYLLGGRKVNPIIMALSYGATFISASAIVGFGGVAATFGMGIQWLCLLKVAIIGEIWKSRAKLLRNRLFENIASVTG